MKIGREIYTSEWRSGLGLVLDVLKDPPPRILAVGWHLVGTWLSIRPGAGGDDGCVQSGPVFGRRALSRRKVREDESANSVST